MRILAIRIRNLASLEGDTVIDFTQEPLRSAGIFAITGQTGAGKSTILDALCLALYGKTPRYRHAETGVEVRDAAGSTIGQHDHRGILRDGCGECFAEVEFVGVDSNEYRANWSVRRARNRADGNLQAETITLKNLSTNNPVPGRKTELLDEIERLVGLKFEQFTRSVLLAQGDFTAFLKAGKDEKSSLLEKLTGTHIYSEISKRVYEDHKDQTQALKELELKRGGIPTLTSEELLQLQTEKEKFQSEARTQEEIVSEINKELQWHQQFAALKSNLESAVLQHDQAVSNKESALPRIKHLQQVEAVQQIRPAFESRIQSEKQIESKSAEAMNLKSDLAEVNLRQEYLDQAIAMAEQELTKYLKEEETAQPLLEAARSLDLLKSEKEKQRLEFTNEVSIRLEKNRSQEEKTDQERKQSEELKKEIAALRQWKSENEARKSVAENESYVVSKLDEARNLLFALRQHSNRLNDVGKESERGQFEKQQIEVEYQSLQVEIEKEQTEVERLQNELSESPIADLQNEKAEADHTIQELVAADADWKLLSGALRERNRTQKDLSDKQVALEDISQKLVSTNNELQKAEIEKDIAQKLLDKARLAAAEGVENLRAHLIPDEACPVCGSTEHPYAEEDPRLQLVLMELKESFGETEKAHTSIVAEQGKLTQSVAQLHSIIQQLQSDIADQQGSIQKLDENWSRYSIYIHSRTLQEDEIAEWMQVQLRQKREQTKQLQHQIDAIEAKRNELYSKKSEHSVKVLHQHTLNNRIKDFERQLLSFAEQTESSLREVTKANDGLECLRLDLGAYFPSEQWFQNWERDPIVFVEQIKWFSKEWKGKSLKLDECIGLQAVVAATLSASEQQLESLTLELKKSELKVSTAEAELQDLSTRRKAIFAGVPVTVVEEKLKSNIENSRLILDQRKSELKDVDAGKSGIVATLTQIEKDIAILRQQELDARNRIRNWLVEHNRKSIDVATEEGLHALLSYSHEWIEEARVTIKTIEDSLAHSKSVLTERRTALELHESNRLSDQSEEELKAKFVEAKSTLQQQTQQSNNIDFRLQEHERNKQRIGQLLLDIEKQSLVVENWSKLNEIIGSADGKKFRQIAQEYTLDVLLSYANVHLEALSSRYVLQRVPDSLGLQVIDQDMGDEVRTVFSLSGGESFLVSLALALGLASLSSSRMKVESLFIDEGFGSLDPATLNIAMDALERLHNQGRKVGVISHVQEMTERIAVRIKVSRQQSGKSLVQVEG